MKNRFTEYLLGNNFYSITVDSQGLKGTDKNCATYYMIYNLYLLDLVGHIENNFPFLQEFLSFISFSMTLSSVHDYVNDFCV